MGVGSSAGVRNFAKAALKTTAIGVSALALQATGEAWAQSADTLSGVTVEADQVELESPKYAAPLLDTPQTITVVNAEVIQQQNLLNLRDVLSTLPGITFGAGEGGGGYGDSINIRGFSANNDITVDGVRDSAQYSRTDPFNLEQIELTNGANSVYAGAGSVGGSINLVSKRPNSSDVTAITVGAGTDAYGRITADINQPVSETSALRLNVMMHHNDVPGRDVEEFQRFGIAPSFTFGLGTPTRITLSYLHQQDENTPQYGVPYALNAFNSGIIEGADNSAYYGWSNIDRQEIGVDQATLLVEHDFNENLGLRNLTRVQRVKQDAVITNLGGATYCTPAGINPYTGEACAPAGTRTIGSADRTSYRDTENDLIYNQTDLTWRFNTGGISHSLVAGVSLSHEEYDLDTGRVLYFADGTPAFATRTLDLDDFSNVYGGPVNFRRATQSAAELDNYALYVFDAIELSEHWEINGGVRGERHESSAHVRTFDVGSGVLDDDLVSETENDLLSYRGGVVFKPTPNSSIYVAYGNSESPPQTSVLVTSINSSCVTAGTCNSDPEEAETTEVGVKWNALGGRLGLTAAAFRNERSAFYVESDITGQPDRLDGRSRVDGVALGASGLLTDNWSVFANYTYLDSELLQDVADAAVGESFRAGDPLPSTPEHAFSVWTTYDLSNGFMVGYGATYQGEMTFNRFDEDAALYYTDDYWVHRAMIAYEVNRNLVLQLNANNLTDEEYYTRIRNNATNGWATPGEARSFVLSANMRF